MSRAGRGNHGGGAPQSNPQQHVGQSFLDHCATQRRAFLGVEEGNGAGTQHITTMTSHHLQKQLQQCETCTTPSYAARIRQTHYPFLPSWNLGAGGSPSLTPTTTSTDYSEFGRYSLPSLHKPVNTSVAMYRLTREERLVSCRFSPDGQMLAVLGQDKLFSMNSSSHSFQYGDGNNKNRRELERAGEGGGHSSDWNVQYLREDLHRHSSDHSSHQNKKIASHDPGHSGHGHTTTGPLGEGEDEEEADDVPTVKETKQPKPKEDQEDDDEPTGEEADEDDDDGIPDPLLDQLFGLGYSQRHRQPGGVPSLATAQARQMMREDLPGVTAGGRAGKKKEGGAGSRGVLDSIHNIHSVGWSLLDCCWSADSQLVAVGGWSSHVHLYRRQDLGVGGGMVHQKTVNVDVSGDGEEEDAYYGGGRGPGVFCLSFLGSHTDKIVCGTNQNVAVAVDVERRQVLGTYSHLDDVNAVSAFPDGHTFVSGSDDATIKVHDIRSPVQVGGVGFLLGHAQGLASVDCHSDGYHVVSAGKDQCSKLFDIRKMVSTKSTERIRALHEGALHAAQGGRDYRYGNAAPPPSCATRDNSLLTFHGSHYTVVTLCHARISPTGRYVACASADSVVAIYDTLSGEAFRLEGHDSVVRDVSWHPDLPLVASASWDGTVRLYGNDEYVLKGGGPPLQSGKPASGVAAGGSTSADGLMGLAPDDFYDALDTDGDDDEEEFY